MSFSSSDIIPGTSRAGFVNQAVAALIPSFKKAGLQIVGTEKNDKTSSLTVKNGNGKELCVYFAAFANPDKAKTAPPSVVGFSVDGGHVFEQVATDGGPRDTKYPAQPVLEKITAALG